MIRQALHHTLGRLHRLRPHRYVTARAVIIDDGKLLVFKRSRLDKTGKRMHYYSLPGGKLDVGERTEDAVKRELMEEMGVEIRVGEKIGHYRGRVFDHTVYSADIVSGKPQFVDSSEEARLFQSVNNTYEVAWVPIDTLKPDELKYYSSFFSAIVREAKRQAATRD